MPSTQVMGILPYDVAGLHAHVGGVLADAARVGKTKLVLGASWAKDEAKSIREQFKAVPKGTSRDLPGGTTSQDLVIDKLKKVCAELESQGLGVADSDSFFQDVMALYQQEAHVAFNEAQRRASGGGEF